MNAPLDTLQTLLLIVAICILIGAVIRAIFG